MNASEPLPFDLFDMFGMAQDAAETVTVEDEIVTAPAVSVASIFSAVWLCGACVLGSVVLCKWLRVWRIVRRTTAETFGKLALKHPDLKADDPVRHLSPLLHDENEDVRERAAYAIGMFGPRAASRHIS